LAYFLFKSFSFTCSLNGQNDSLQSSCKFNSKKFAKRNKVYKVGHGLCIFLRQPAGEARALSVALATGGARPDAQKKHCPS
jgi:hypothetical protein